MNMDWGANPMIAEEKKSRNARLDRLCVIAAGVLPILARGMSLRDDLDDHVLAANVSRVSRAILAKLEEE